MQTMRWIDGWVGLVRRWPALLVFWGALSFAFGALAATDNKSCLECHDAKAPKIEVPDAQGKTRKLLALAPDAFGLPQEFRQLIIGSPGKTAFKVGMFDPGI